MVKSSSSNNVLYSPHCSVGVRNETTTNTTSNTPKVSNIRKKQYKGVRMRSWGSWVSEIRAPNQKTRIWLGSYSTPEAAARAYDAALLCLKGSSASLNFPDSSPHHLSPTLMSPKSIQRIAAAAANDISTAANATTITPSPFPPVASSPSPSPSSNEDTIVMSSGNAVSGLIEEESPSLTESWIDFGAFQSPKCMDQMLNQWAFFAPSQVVEECEDYEGDIRLWSFC